jgi:pre-mRNA-splicing factor CWC26
MLNSYLDKYKGKVENNSSDFQTKGKKKKSKPKNMEDLFSNEDFEDPEFAPTIVDLKEFKAEEAEKERLKRLNSKISEKQAGWKVIETKKRHDTSSDEDEQNEKKNPILNTLNQQNNQIEPQKMEDFGSRRRRTRNDSDSEESEDNQQQRQQHHQQASPSSSPRKRTYSSDSEELPTKEDLSPRRRRRRTDESSSDSDSPPRRIKRSDSPNNRRKQEPTIILKKGGENNLAGLKTAQELDAHVNAQKNLELKNFQAMKPSETGQFASTIYRDKEGKIISKEEHEILNQKKKKKNYVIQKDFEWGKGLVQKKNEENLEEKLSKLINKPFATHEGEDSDYENELKDQLRDGDPMAKFLTKNKKKKKRNSRPEYEGAMIPNRYNIRPGHLWDGIDRSNGFEKKFFQAQSKLSNQRSKEYDDFE